MHIEDIPLEPEFIEIFKKEGIEYLYPPQAEAIPEIFRGKNLVVAIPTASGKTIIAYTAILRAFKMGLKSAYIVPLRALAMEKYEELKRFESLGLRVALAIGDYDSSPGALRNFDVVIATSEKMDSLLRHSIEFAYDLGVVILDEVHLLGDESRGPTLEMVITKIRDVNDSVQIIALSATVGNSEDIAKWLNAIHIYSEFRPVPLKLGVYYDDTLKFINGDKENIKSDSMGIGNLVISRIKSGGQVMIFVSTRRSAESLAEKLSLRVSKHLTPEESENLEIIANSFMDEEYTVFGEKLAKLIRKGVCFHHAGLSNSQRATVEKAFKKRLLKVIVATPTLAAGINLPSRTVIVRDLTRYDGYGSSYISVMEVKQMLGRAGRPKYDRWGEGIIYAKNSSRAKEFEEVYLKGDVENIKSQLSNESALRTHLLALIASDITNSEEGIISLFEKTFYGYQMPVSLLKNKIERILIFLEENEFIKRKRLLMPTPLGKRVSDLYLDPYSAIIFRKAYDMSFEPFMVLHTICCTPDMKNFYARRSEIEDLVILANLHRLALDEFEIDNDIFFSALKTAALILDWANEIPQDMLIEKYGVGPGDIHSRVELADWLLYAFSEIGKVLKYPYYREVEQFRMRVKYGVKEELLPLVSLKGVGRVRARRLYDSGFRTLEDLQSASVSDLRHIPGIGEKLAREILKQVRGEK